MKHLHIDCAAGVSGDMLLGMLLDLGVDQATFEARLAAANIGGYELSISPVVKAGIRATHINVTDTAGPQHHEQHHQPPDHDHDNKEPKHDHAHRGPHRHLKDLLAIADVASLSPDMIACARSVFTLLAEVEGEIHNRDPEKIHFHEVSGVDTAVDVLGVLIALDWLGVTSISCGTVAVGNGTFRCAHGVLPLPAPATAQILARYNIPYAQVEVDQELLTPTGAALLAVLVASFGTAPALRPERTGYGAGTRELTGRPNVLRGILGTTDSDSGTESDSVVEFRATIDDMTPEAIGYLTEACFAANALDVYTVAAMMKKQRPGIELTVLARPADADAVEAAIFQHSRTFGVRRQTVARSILAREVIRVSLDDFSVRVKIGRYRGHVTAVSPEFDDCAQAAEDLQISLAEVFNLAENEARRWLAENTPVGDEGIPL